MEDYQLENALRAKRAGQREAENKNIEVARQRKEAEKRGEVLPQTVEAAHQKAIKEVLSNPDYSIQAPQFIKTPSNPNAPYSEADVHNDMREVLSLRKKFEASDSPEAKNAKKMAEVFEAVMLVYSELGNWLGEAQTLRTSLYDDYLNGTDMLAEWSSSSEGTRVLALAVDITFSTLKLQKKLERIKKEVDNDLLGTLRYFKDVHGDFMGTRNNVPRVVIGVSGRVVEELSSLWVKNEPKALSAHGVQRLIVEEIHQQVSSILAYAQAQNKPNAVRAYEQLLAITGKLVEEKSSIKLGDLMRDPVAGAIISQTQSKFRC